MLFDTLKPSEDLQESFSLEQARTLTRALSNADSEHLATKADLTALENRLIKWISTAIGFKFAATVGSIITLTKVFGH